MATHDTDADAGNVATIVRALADEGYEDVLVLDADAGAEILTERRQELLDAIETDDDRSIGELADALDRSHSAVSRDLDVLFEYGIVDYRTDGRRKLPYVEPDTVLLEPIL